MKRTPGSFSRTPGSFSRTPAPQTHPGSEQRGVLDLAENFHKKSAPETNSKAISRGFRRGRFSDLMENRSFWGSGQPRAARKPFEKVGGKAPYPSKGLLGRPGPPRNPKRPISHQIAKRPFVKPPVESRSEWRPRKFARLPRNIVSIRRSNCQLFFFGGVKTAGRDFDLRSS